MPERRYSQYQQEDVWAQLYQLQHRLGVIVQDGTIYGHSVWLTWKNRQVKAVVLARSSDWYAYSLNCVERFKHELDVVVCGTHDSCLDRPVLALDVMHWYEPLKMRLDSLEPSKQRDAQGRPMDAFEQRRKSHYGHNMLIGALLCGRADAFKRLETLRPSTRLRIEAEVRRLHMRRRGRPLKV
jgi:hypothetical protein